MSDLLVGIMVQIINRAKLNNIAVQPFPGTACIAIPL